MGSHQALVWELAGKDPVPHCWAMTSYPRHYDLTLAPAQKNKALEKGPQLSQGPRAAAPIAFYLVTGGSPAFTMIHLGDESQLIPTG